MAEQPLDELVLRIHALEALARTGLAWQDVGGYDRERYERVLQLAAEMAALIGQPASYDREMVEKLRLGWLAQIQPNSAGYVTPKLGTQGAVVRHDDDGLERLLLIRRADNGEWRLPGGFCEVGIAPPDNTVKEVFEETGIIATPLKLIAMLDTVGDKRLAASTVRHHNLHITVLLFLCRTDGGALKPHPLEVLETNFFSQSEAEKLVAPDILPLIRHIFAANNGNPEVYFSR
jgi:ADP-ribose pyrophosphatase YjhB (NUDIX family)